MKHYPDPTAASITSATSSQLVATSGPASINEEWKLRRGRAGSDHSQPKAATGRMLLTLNEVAVELRCARRSVERLIAAHEIRTVRFVRCGRIERAELAGFIAGHNERHQAADDATSA